MGNWNRPEYGDRVPGPSTPISRLRPTYNSEAGVAFKRFITIRWPRSHILPRQQNESEENYQAREKNAIKNYEEWIKKQFTRFMMEPEKFAMPYTMVLLDGKNYSNFPPDDCRLKEPMNVGSLYSKANFFSHWVLLLEEKKYDYDWVVKWNDIEKKFPYLETKDLTNYRFQPENEKEDEIDVEKARALWTEWFTRTWPFPAQDLPYFNETLEGASAAFSNAKLRYNEWVEKNWKQFWSRQPDGDYWDWPLPYDKKGNDMINAPPREIQLKTGFQRTIFLLNGNSPPEAITVPSLQKSWVSLWYNWNRNSIGRFWQLSEGIDEKVNDPFKIPLLGNFDEKEFTNRFWGYGGIMQRKYPVNNFPPRYNFAYDYELANGNYGLIDDWPDPYDMAAEIRLISSHEMAEPSLILLEYWSELIRTYQNRNEDLYVMPFSIFATPDQQKDWKSDRIGFKMFPERKSYFRRITHEMERIDKKYEKFLPDFHNYLFSLMEGNLKTIGIFVDQEEWREIFEYQLWKRVVLQSIHLRYAERHYFYPWEKFQNFVEPSTFPSNFNEIISSEGFVMKWEEWVWADNFLSANQKQAIARKETPFDFKPFVTDVISWDNLRIILQSIQGAQNQGKKDMMRVLSEEAIYFFGKFVYHPRREKGEDTKYLDPIGSLRLFLQNKGITERSSSKTWDELMNFLFNNLYRTCMDSKIELKKKGKCSIIPGEKLNEKCIVPVDDNNDEDFDKGHDYQRICFAFWKNQWLATEALVDWPTCVVNERGELEYIVAGTKRPIPSFWEKFINLFRGNTDIGYEMPKDEKDKNVSNGFVLPKVPGKNIGDFVLKCFNFMSVHKLPTIREQPVINTQEWVELKNLQWAHYMQWVEVNVKAQKEPHYAEPGLFLKRPDGTEVLDENNKQVINLFPALGVFALRKKDSFDWLFNPADWVDAIFGQKSLLAMLLDTLTKLSTFVIDVIRQLIRVVTEGFGIGVTLLIAIAMGGALYLMGQPNEEKKNRAYVENEIKKRP